MSEAVDIADLVNFVKAALGLIGLHQPIFNFLAAIVQQFQKRFIHKHPQHDQKQGMQ